MAWIRLRHIWGVTEQTVDVNTDLIAYIKGPAAGLAKTEIVFASTPSIMVSDTLDEIQAKVAELERKAPDA